MKQIRLDKGWSTTVDKFILSLGILVVLSQTVSAQTTPPMAARVINAPQINGSITGSIQQMLGQGLNLNSGAIITGDFFTPGIPNLNKNGNPQFQGIQLGTGATTPSGYYITLNSGSQLRYLVERTNAVAFTAVPTPTAPTGTRDINVNPGNVSTQIGTWSTVHNLNLNSNVGAVTVPAGSYGTFTANSGTSFVLGTAGATTASTYSFDGLTLNSTSNLTINGPVIIKVKSSVTVNSSCVLGNSQNPSWCSLKITSSGLTINSNGTLYGFVEAPTSSVNINGKLVGSVISANNLTVNSGGSIQGQAQNAPQPPTVSIISPTNAQVVQPTAATLLQATASDPQGTITKVDFYANNGSGAVKIGTGTTAPYTVSWNVPPGTYTLTAIATDSLGLTTTSSPVTFYSDFPPSLQPSTSANVIAAGGSVTIYSAATDSDGSISMVQFYANGQLIGQSTTAPYSYTWNNVAAGSYNLTIKATDNEGGVTSTSLLSVTSDPAPVVSITTPTDASQVQNPANVPIQVIATSPSANGSVKKVDFFADSGSGAVQIAEVTQAPYNFSWNQPAVGTYVLTAVATDNLGIAGISTPVHVQVFGWNTLTETTKFVSEQSYPVTIPAAPQVLAISFRNLSFDTTATGLNKDAFEIALLDSNGKPLVSTIAPGRDSFFNNSEVSTPALAQGVATSTANGVTTVYLNISQVPAGTQATLVARLVNNDTDTATTVQVGQLVSFPATMPTAQPYADAAENLPNAPLDFTNLTNLTTSFSTQFDRSSFNDQATVYYVRIAEKNIDQYQFKGRLAAVVDQISDPSVTVANADGFNPAGFPYIDFTASTNGGMLAPQASSLERTVAFNNPNHIQFTYHITVMGDPNHPPAFEAVPTTTAYIGQSYSFADMASDSDHDGLTYSILSGPTGLTIDPVTGKLSWSPGTSLTPGSYLVTVVVSDGRGGATTQTFTINLQAPPSNRPPIFTSTPTVDAIAAQSYLYTAQATDPDGNTVTYSVVSGPTGLTIDAHSGAVTWTPTADQAGTSTVTLQADDGQGGTAKQTYQVLIVTQAAIAASSSNSVPIFLKPTLLDFTPLSFTPNDSIVSDAPGVGNQIHTGVNILGDVPFTIPGGLTTWAANIAPGNPKVLDMYMSIPDAGEVDTLINTFWGAGGPNAYAYVEFFGSNGAYYVKPLVGNVDIRDFNNGYYTNYLNTSNTIPVLFGISQYGQSDRLDRQIIPLPAAFQSQQLVHVRLTDYGGDNFQRIIFTGASALAPLQTGGAVLQNGLPFSYNFIAQDANNDPITYGATNLPSGATVDSTTGAFNWTPGAQGTYSVVFTATNSSGVAQLPITFRVLGNLSDYPPAITSNPRTQIGFGKTYYYIVNATNPNGNPLAYSLTQAPAGMTISPGGYLSWTPTAAQLGANPVTIQVSDGRSTPVTQTFSINVLGINPNSSPTISSQAPTGAVVGTVYSYNVQATDPDNDTLVYTLVKAPHGMSINSLLGTVRWVPTLDQIGVQNVTVQVNDSYGGLTTQTFAVTVRGVNAPPNIFSVPNTAAAINTAYTYQVAAVDPNSSTIGYSLNNPPPGMTIDPNLGLIQWTPSAGQAGNYAIEVVATNASGAVGLQDYTLVVATTPSVTSPRITSAPPFGVVDGGTYSTTIAATDPTGGTLTYSLLSGPSGMTVDPNTGLVTWTASTTNGIHPVSIQIQSSSGGSAVLSYLLTVGPAQPPVISSVPVTQAYNGQNYVYPVIAHSPTGNPLNYALVTGPSGMSVDAGGSVHWTVPTTTSGTIPVTLRVSDNYGNAATQNFNLVVATDSTAPTVNIISTTNVVKIGEQVGVQVIATDNVQVSNIVLTQNGTPLALDRNNIVYVTLSTSGLYNFVATVTDEAGNTTSQTLTVRCIDPNSNDYPNVIVDQANLQAINGIITSQTPIIATIQDTKLEAWQVQVAPTNQIDQSNVAGDSPAYKTIATGTTAVNDAQVATLDPTVLANGSYFMRVIATNTDGNVNARGVILTVESQNKLGRFFYSTTDLNIPLAGIPIQITRTYDSLNAGNSGDFGFGWSLSGVEAQVQTSVPPPAQGVPNFFSSQGASFRVGSTVTITTPEGKRESFRFVPQLANLGIPGEPPGFGFFGATYRASYQPEQGVYDTLTSDQTVIQVNGNGSVGGYLFNTSYNPTDFYLTTKDGHVYHYDTTNGLDDVHDRDGVSLTYTHGGIFSSTGASITYTRDSVTDRITAITDPRGNKIQYFYDSNGNLTSEIDQAGRKTQYTYLATPAHFLDKLVDAKGHPIAKTAFDASGRLSTFTDALGNITTFLYDPVNLIQTKVEPLDPTTGTNPATVTFYDARGNVTQVTNEIGNVSTTTYDANNNPLTVTMPNGDKATFTYDGNGNQLTKKDPLGNVTTNTYDGQNNLTSVTDPLGNRTAYSYDGSGNLTSVVDPLGNSTQLGNDDLGRPVSLTDALGHTTQFAYTDDPDTGIAATKPSVVTQSDGSTLKFTYNSFGSVTSATDENGNEIQLVADNGGILQKRIEADGATTTYAYDSNGNLTDVTDALGKVTHMDYDAAFHLAKRTGPNGEVTQFTYDQLGRLSSKIDPLNRITARHYRADGVMASITQPDNTVITFDNDVNGRRTGLTDPNGNHTTFAYNGNSQVTSQTDPLGKITQYSYDGAGNMSNVMDRLGRVRQFAYNGNNQLITETWLDSVTATTPSKTISTNYDVVGNVSGVSDDTGTLAMIYDQRNRLQTLTTNYTGQSAFVLNYGYDAGSRITSVTDGDGAAVGTSYDQRNQVSQITWQIASIAASAKFAHDPLGALTSIKRYSDATESNLIGQTTYSYARNLPDVGYRAAAFNAGGDQTQTAGFAQTEAFGPLQNDADTNGLLASGTQPFSRLGGVTHQNGSGATIQFENYSNDQAGQLQTKSIGADTATFAYDQTGQLTKSTHSASTSLNESYTYDASGNRTKTDSQSSSNTVAANNRIIADATYTYAYDDEGNLITKTETATTRKWAYSYDLRNRLTSAVQTDSGNNTLSQAIYIYDVLNRRITKSVNGTTTQYFYKGDNLWKQVGTSGTMHYLIGGAIDQWLARASASGVNWYLTDRLGSVTGITDATGALSNSTTYDSYGHILSQSNPAVADSLAFTGREYDIETGNYYFRARYYNPDLGKFLSEDKITFSASDYILSRYVGNNPLEAIDPLGLAAQNNPESDRTLQKRRLANEYFAILKSGQQGRAALYNGGRTEIRIINSINNKLKVVTDEAGHLVPARNDLLNNPIVKNGKAYDHFGEVAESIQGLIKDIYALSGSTSPAAAQATASALNAILEAERIIFL